MAPTIELIESITLSSTSLNVTFSNIPQKYNDLYIAMSIRGTSSTYVALGVRYNGSHLSQTGKNLSASGTSTFSYADQSTTFSNVNTYARLTGFYPATQVQTANSFTSIEWYISNYSGSTSKPSSITMATESNSTSQNVTSIETAAVLWSENSPLNSLTL